MLLGPRYEGEKETSLKSEIEESGRSLVGYSSRDGNRRRLGSNRERSGRVDHVETLSASETDDIVVSAHGDDDRTSSRASESRSESDSALSANLVHRLIDEVSEHEDENTEDDRRAQRLRRPLQPHERERADGDGFAEDRFGEGSEGLTASAVRVIDGQHGELLSSEECRSSRKADQRIVYVGVKTHYM